ncbi:hypothetical protein [Luteimonas terrae]|uniref:Uncharacterized protein n=1 Tax=Luteimonas terrae TaxID=1530191 RepID=A0ABU1XW06_9GAMM|nr:hypothetical protein [Luteimonas terrae]MDR7192944.1 hypothetical protein [Luteimonas terrae]
MSVQSIRQSDYTPPPPPPPPRVETLRTSTPEAANATVAAMDANQADAFNAEVQALPASDRQTLLNDLATKLDAGNLVRLHETFGREAVADTVELRSGVETRETYQALTGTTPSGPSLPQLPAGMPPMDIARIEAQQVQRAQEDFAAQNIGSGALGAPYQLGTLASQHATEPAYLGELVRLANDAGVLDAATAPNWGLFSRDAEGGYMLAGADADSARSGLTTALGVAIERGVLSEGQIRHSAADNAGWREVASALGIDNVGRTQQTREAASALEELQNTYNDAKAEADTLNEELATHLLRAGPLTPEQQADFIEAFRSADGHADIYAAEADAGQALASHVEANRETLLAAAVRDPAVAAQMVDTLGQLADSGHGELALALLGEIQGVPDSALAGAFSAHTEALQGELFERIASAATVEIVARHDGDLQAAVADLKEAFAPLQNAKGLFDGVKGGISSFQDGMAMMDAIAAGDFDPLKKLGDEFGEASPFAHAMAGVGVVMGAIKASQSTQEGEYLEAVQGFASAGESGLNLLAGAAKHVADAGRLAQYGDDAARFATFAARLAPGLGVLASATSVAINVQKAAEDGNVGYAVAAMGDVFGMLGSAVALIPGPGTAAGSMVSGIGAVISAIGGFVGDAIDKHQTREELRGYMEAAGIEPAVIDAMLHAGETAHEVAGALGLDAEAFQALVIAHPDVAASPGHLGAFADLAAAAGISGDQVQGFADAMAGDKPDFAWDIFGLQSALPTSPAAREAMLRDYLEGNYGSAYAVAENASPELFGDAAQQQENARADYERNGFDMSYELALGNVLIRNDDPAYRAEMIRLLNEDGRLEIWVEGLAGYGGDWADATRASLDDAVAAGVIDRSTAEELQAALS